MSEPHITLTPAELVGITGYVRAKDQHRVFMRLGVPAILRPDNTLSVGRAHYNGLMEKHLSGNIAAPIKAVRNVRKQHI